jgi:hypothetical protein
MVTAPHVCHRGPAILSKAIPAGVSGRVQVVEVPVPAATRHSQILGGKLRRKGDTGGWLA